MTNSIDYTVTNPMGEETFLDVPVEKALEDIKNYMVKESKWLFIDQNQETLETINTKKLLNASVIMVTDMLGGG